MASEVSAKNSPLMTSPLAPADAARSAPKPAAAAETPRPAPQPGKSFSDELAKADTAKPDAPKAAPARQQAPAKLDDNSSADAKADVKADTKPDTKTGAQQDTKSAATDSGRKDELKPLKQAATSNKQAIASAPAIALLTGKVEQLAPEDIPDLVNDNAFVNTAISEEDLTNFFATPAAIGDMLEALDLPKQVISDAEKYGVNMNAAVSPSEFLRSIGVDPQRVFAELKVLKDNILAGGVQSYMARAQGGAGDPVRDLTLPDDHLDIKNAPNLARSQALGQTLPNTSVNPAFAETQRPAVDSGKPAMRQRVNLQEIIGAIDSTKDADADVDLSAILPAALAQLGQPASFGAMASVGAADVSKVADASVDAIHNLDAMPAEAGDPASLKDMNALGGKATPSLNRGTFDAWAQMGDRLRASSTDVTTNAAPTATPVKRGALSLEEQLLSRQVTSLNAPVAADANTQNVATLGQTLSAKTSSASSQTNASLRTAGIDPRLLQDLTARADARESRLDAVPVGRIDRGALVQSLLGKDGIGKIDATMSVDDLRLAAPTLTGASIAVDGAKGKEQQSGFSGDQEESRDFSMDQGAGERLASMTHAGVAHKTPGSFSHALAGPETHGLSTEQRANLVQSVMDRTVALAHDGGGTVRLDLGSPELGHLQMAIKMNDDRIDMRIMTSNDRVRDAMMADLNRLRDALSVQNVQLGNVEVGVGGRNPSAFAGFAGQNPFEQRQAQADARGDDRSKRDLERGLEKIGAVKRATLPHVAAMSLINQNGTLAIRA